jgi:DNA repair exonuclease SbcCD nuclease subunit
MKFLLTNDLHLSHRGPQSRLDNWQETIFEKLGQIEALAIKLNVAAILIAGDIFHSKSKITFATLLRLMIWGYRLKAHGIRVLAIPGNHDEVHDRYESLDSQPLGVLFQSGAFENVTGNPVVLSERRDDADPQATLTVSVSGLPYPQAMSRDEFDKLPAHPNCEVNILMAHCYATVEGGSYFGEPIHKYEDLAALPYEVFHFGHDHSDHGVVEVAGKTFVNIGALTRGSIAQDDANRAVKIALLTVTAPWTVDVQQVRLKFKPAHEVFDLDLHAKKQRENVMIQEFVGSLSGDLAGVTADHNFKDIVGGMTLTDTVRARAIRYIEESELLVP